LASQDLFAFEIPPVRDDDLKTHCGLRLLRDRRELASVIPDISRSSRPGVVLRLMARREPLQAPQSAAPAGTSGLCSPSFGVAT
jgi:hypothetical protein